MKQFFALFFFLCCGSAVFCSDMPFVAHRVHTGYIQGRDEVPDHHWMVAEGRKKADERRFESFYMIQTYILKHDQGRFVLEKDEEGFNRHIDGKSLMIAFGEHEQECLCLRQMLEKEIGNVLQNAIAIDAFEKLHKK